MLKLNVIEQGLFLAKFIDVFEQDVMYRSLLLTEAKIILT